MFSLNAEIYTELAEDPNLQSFIAKFGDPDFYNSIPVAPTTEDLYLYLDDLIARSTSDVEPYFITFKSSVLRTVASKLNEESAMQQYDSYADPPQLNEGNFDRVNVYVPRDNGINESIYDISSNTSPVQKLDELINYYNSISNVNTPDSEEVFGLGEFINSFVKVLYQSTPSVYEYGKTGQGIGSIKTLLNLIETNNGSPDKGEQILQVLVYLKDRVKVLNTLYIRGVDNSDELINEFTCARDTFAFLIEELNKNRLKQAIKKDKPIPGNTEVLIITSRFDTSVFRLNVAEAKDPATHIKNIAEYRERLLLDADKNSLEIISIETYIGLFLERLKQNDLNKYINLLVEARRDSSLNFVIKSLKKYDENKSTNPISSYRKVISEKEKAEIELQKERAKVFRSSASLQVLLRLFNIPEIRHVIDQGLYSRANELITNVAKNGERFRDFTPILAALYNNARLKPLLMLALELSDIEESERIIDQILYDGKNYIPELIIGSGPAATAFSIARFNKTGQKSLLVESKDKRGGQFNNSEVPFHPANSRQRQTDYDKPPIPGTSADLNRLGKGSVIELGDLNANTYPDQNVIGDTVAIAGRFSSSVLLNCEFLSIKENDTNNPGKYQVMLFDKSTKLPFYIYTDRLIDAEGNGMPNIPFNKADRETTRIVREENDKGMENGRRFFTVPAFLSYVSKRTMPLQGIENVTIIGGGDFAKCLILYLTGYFGDRMQSVINLDSIKNITWLGKDLPASKEEFLAKSRVLYAMLGLELPREDKEYYFRVKPIDGKSERLSRVSSGKLAVYYASGRNQSAVSAADIVIAATGYDRGPDRFKEIGGLDMPDNNKFEPFNVDGVSDAVATKIQGHQIYKIGVTSDIPVSANEFVQSSAFANIPQNSAAMYRYLPKAAELANSLPGQESSPNPRQINLETMNVRLNAKKVIRANRFSLAEVLEKYLALPKNEPNVHTPTSDIAPIDALRFSIGYIAHEYMFPKSLEGKAIKLKFESIPGQEILKLDLGSNQYLLKDENASALFRSLLTDDLFRQACEGLLSNKSMIDKLVINIPIRSRKADFTRINYNYI